MSRLFLFSASHPAEASISSKRTCQLLQGIRDRPDRINPMSQTPDSTGLDAAVLAGQLGVVSMALFVAYLVSVLAFILPLRLLAILWQLSSIKIVIEAAPIPLIGLAMHHLAGRLSFSRQHRTSEAAGGSVSTGHPGRPRFSADRSLAEPCRLGVLSPFQCRSSSTASHGHPTGGCSSPGHRSGHQCRRPSETTSGSAAGGSAHQS